MSDKCFRVFQGVEMSPVRDNGCLRVWEMLVERLAARDIGGTISVDEQGWRVNLANEFSGQTSVLSVLLVEGGSVEET
jgi:hypothetical protein